MRNTYNKFFFKAIKKNLAFTWEEILNYVLNVINNDELN